MGDNVLVYPPKFLANRLIVNGAIPARWGYAGLAAGIVPVRDVCPRTSGHNCHERAQS